MAHNEKNMGQYIESQTTGFDLKFTPKLSTWKLSFEQVAMQ
jgi:hypothetical protein